MAGEDRAEDRPIQRLLVTGGNGALGSRLVDALLARGREVVAVDRMQPEIPKSHDNLTFHCRNLLDFPQIEPLFEGVDCVIHTAALHGYHLPGSQPASFFTNNALGLFHVVWSCHRAGVPRLVVTSSTSIYTAGRRPNGTCHWYTEQSPTAWSDLYDITKLLGEKLCESWGAKLDVISLRTARFFRENYVDYEIRKLNRGVDLLDAVEAHCLAAQLPIQPGHRVYNIAARSPFDRGEADELARDTPAVLERHFPGVGELFRSRGWRLPDRLDRVYDIGKAEQELGYRPKHNFHQFFLKENSQ